MKTDPKPRHQFSFKVPELPETATTKDGAVFDPRAKAWTIQSLVSRPTVFDFGGFSNISEGAVLHLKFGVLHHLRMNSFGHSRNLYQRFAAFYREVIAPLPQVVQQIGLGHILTYRGMLDHKTEWKLGALRILLSDMDRLGFSIVTREALDYLNDSVFRGNVKGTSVRTRDANDGAFNDGELLSIQAALNDAYAKAEIGLYDFAAAWLFLAYGARPVQIAALKEEDLIIAVEKDIKLYALRVPRAKQRGEDIRGSFKTRYCSKQVGQLLEAVLAVNRRKRSHYRLKGDDWPIFMGDEPGELPGLQHHLSSSELGQRVSSVIGKLTGLKANVKRFRITLAQRAADDGKDQYTLAELLDHSDTQNVGVYYEASPAMALRLDRHLAMEMAPLAQAFAGVVVTTEHDARRGNDRASRIYDRSLPNNVDDPLGSCGQMSFCGLSVPFACYTCRHFQPWLDAPHEQFLDALIGDRERMVAEEYSPKIYTIRDRTILAVAEVIQLCASVLEGSTV